MEKLTSLFLPILERAPWLNELLGWVVIILLLFLVWVSIGFPSLLIEGFIRNKRAQFSGFLNNAWEQLEEYKKNNSLKAENRKHEFLKSRRGRSIADLSFSFWNNPIRKAARVVDRVGKNLRRQINKTGKMLKVAIEKMAKSLDRLEKLSLPASNVNKDIPNTDQLDLK